MENKSINTNNLLSRENIKIRVSSTLNSKEFAGSNMIDGVDDTCWNSNQGKAQQVVLELKKTQPENFSKFEFISAGGFCPKNITFYITSEDITVNKAAKFYKLKEFNEIKDTSEKQTLEFDKKDFEEVIKEFIKDKGEDSKFVVKTVKLMMNTFYDFFGRVAFYDIKMY